MFNIRLTDSGKGSYLYRCSIEIMGRAVEFGLSHQEVSRLKKIGRTALKGPVNLVKNWTPLKGGNGKPNEAS